MFFYSLLTYWLFKNYYYYLPLLVIQLLHVCLFHPFAEAKCEIDTRLTDSVSIRRFAVISYRSLR